MSIAYKFDVLSALKTAGYSTTKIRREKLLSESTLQALRESKPISWANLERLCALLNCQPGDILKYVVEGAEREQAIHHPTQEKRTFVVTTRSETIPAKPMVFKVPIHETEPAKPIILKLPVQKAEPIQKPIIVHAHNKKDTED